jgi:L-ascorbate metabolism protein UlaG (beta-lactamase superfamily)
MGATGFGDHAVTVGRLLFERLGGYTMHCITSVLRRRSLPAAAIILATTCWAALLHADELTGDHIPTDDGALVIHPIGHATFVMGWKDTVIYVDPVGGAAAFEGLPKPNLILITDIHGDHLNADTVQAVRTDTTAIIAPAAVAEKLPEALRNATTVLANGKRTEAAGVGVEAIPMYNLTKERMRFHTKGRGNGYVVALGGKRVYISGDTEDIPEMRKLENIDAAFVCMNLPYTMTVERAADAVLEFKPKIVYPYHFRGQGGFSDVKKFEQLVGKNDMIQVRQLQWYAQSQ